MLTLALLRHAKAAKDDGEGDHARRLTPSGRTDAAASGAWLRTALSGPVLVLASDAKRTQETAELAFPEPRGTAEIRFEADLYGASMPDLLHRIRILNEPSTVVLVGHNPGIGEAARALAGFGADETAMARLRQGFPTSSCAVLQFDDPWSDIGPGLGRVAALRVRDGTD